MWGGISCNVFLFEIYQTLTMPLAWGLKYALGEVHPGQITTSQAITGIPLPCFYYTTTEYVNKVHIYPRKSA